MTRFRKLAFVLCALLLAPLGLARTYTTSKSPKKDAKVVESPRTRRRLARLPHRRAGVRQPSLPHHRRHYEHFTTSSFAEDITEGDLYAGEDAVVRQAAVDALGNMNGTV